MNWFKRNKVVIVSSFIMILPVIIYVWHFRDHEVSDSPEDWGTFGDYIGGVYSVLVALIVLYLSHQLEKNRGRDASIKEHAEELFKQIGVIKNNNYNLNSCSKLLTLVNKAKLYLPPRICEMTESLANNYMSHKNDEMPLNQKLEQDTIKELKRIYGS